MRNKKSKRGFIMKKFREFLNERTECTKGDIIGIVVNSLVLLGFNLYACKKINDLELENTNLLCQLESENVQDNIEKIIDIATESTVDLEF